MEAVKALCIRLINRKTYDKETITDMVGVYLSKNRLTQEEYDAVIALIEEVYQ